MEKETLIRFLKCETSPEEELKVLDWLDECPENRKRLDQLDFLFTAALMHQPSREECRRKKVFSTRKILRVMAKSAAVLILMLAGDFLITEYRLAQFSENPVSIEVPSGQRMNITLPDGSTIWLNSETRLSYPALFSRNHRTVQLSGEALFDVKKDDSRPFIVETYACDVEVVGTMFNILAEKETNTFSTTLMRGCVKVRNKSGHGEEMILLPHDKVELVGNHLCRNHSPQLDEALWTEGIISLKGTSFEELIPRLKKAYNINVRVERTALPRISCMGKIRISEGIDHAMKILQTGADFNYEIDYDTRTLIIK